MSSLACEDCAGALLHLSNQARTTAASECVQAYGVLSLALLASPVLLSGSSQSASSFRHLISSSLPSQTNVSVSSRCPLRLVVVGDSTDPSCRTAVGPILTTTAVVIFSGCSKSNGSNHAGLCQLVVEVFLMGLERCWKPDFQSYLPHWHNSSAARTSQHHASMPFLHPAAILTEVSTGIFSS